METTEILQKLCNEILKKHEWPTQWTKSILIAIPKKTNSRKYGDFRTITLISHASKVPLKILQRRRAIRIEEVLSESQAGFRHVRSTAGQIPNVRLLNEKTRDAGGTTIYHNFINFRKAFDGVWHKALWHSMQQFNIGIGMTEWLRQLYDQARIKLMVGNQYSKCFKKTVGVRHGCPLSPTIFNLFLERIMSDALEEYEG